MGYITINGTFLRLWDVGGQENLRTLWESYYQDAHALVFLIDSSDRERLEECKNTFGKYNRSDIYLIFIVQLICWVTNNDIYIYFIENVVTNEVVEGIPILMLANKQDREDRMEVEDIKEIFNVIAEKMGARDSRVLPVSALTG